MEIYLIRHGKTNGNLEKRYIGITDEPLAEQGREELAEIWKDTVLPDPQTVFSSDLIRTRETAEFLFPAIPVRINSGFRECSFGIFENKNYQELCEDPCYRHWIETGGTVAPPGGESKADFAGRTFAAFETAMEEAFRENMQTLAFVIHGGSIMALMEQYGPEGMGFYHWQTENGRGYAVSVAKEKAIKFTNIRRIP